MRYIFVILSFLLLLSGCNSNLHSRLSKDDKGNIHYKGSYKTGNPYEKKGNLYVPEKKVLTYDKTGLASWYGSKDGFHGKKTANGDKYNKKI